MDSGEMWVALLTTVGVALTVVGLVSTWLRLRAVWRDRWPDKELSPPLNAILSWLRRSTNRLLGRTRNVHATFRADTPGVAVAAGSVAWRGYSAPTNSIEDRLDMLRRRVADLEKSYREDVQRVRDEVRRAVAELTDEARDKWAESDKDAREQLRIALGWPAALIVLGTGLQFIAAFIALCRALIGA